MHCDEDRRAMAGGEASGEASSPSKGSACVRERESGRGSSCET